MNVLKELEALKESHYYCEDQWYSCPLAEGGCADDRKPKDKCDCGAEDQHKMVDAIIEYLSNNGVKPKLENPIDFNFYWEILSAWVLDFKPRVSVHQLRGLCERLTTITASNIGLDPIEALHCGKTPNTDFNPTPPTESQVKSELVDALMDVDSPEARDAAIRKECADIADDVGYELGLSNSQRQVLVTFIERGRDER